jgi:predicted nucleic acid-binding protein
MAMPDRSSMRHDWVLIDSDAFIGLLVKEDANHARAEEVFANIQEYRLNPATTNLVVAETATLFSRRSGQDSACLFLDFAKKFQTIYLDERLHQLTVALFEQQRKKNTSFVDMANVVVARELDIPQLAAFDRVYTDDFDLTVL